MGLDESTIWVSNNGPRTIHNLFCKLDRQKHVILTPDGLTTITGLDLGIVLGLPKNVSGATCSLFAGSLRLKRTTFSFIYKTKLNLGINDTKVPKLLLLIIKHLFQTPLHKTISMLSINLTFPNHAAIHITTGLSIFSTGFKLSCSTICTKRHKYVKMMLSTANKLYATNNNYEKQKDYSFGSIEY